MRRITHPEDWPAAMRHFADIQAIPDGEVLEFEQRLKNAHGEWRWVLFRQSVLERRPDGSARITRGTGQDINERKEVEHALRQAREMLDRVIDCAAVGMALVSTDGRFLRVNASLCEFLGYDAWELLECDFQAITHPEDLDADLDQVQQLLEAAAKSYTMEKRYFRKDGAIVWANLSVSLMRDQHGQPLYFLSQVLDITERKSLDDVVIEYAHLLERHAVDLETANRRLQSLASMDALTGLFNRRMLDVRLSDAIELAKQYGRPLSLIMMDVDHFKKFNDVCGHVAGDNALRSVASVVRGGCRLSDVVARFGGEEFAAICPDTGLADAIELAERLRQMVKEYDMQPQRVTCSFGVSTLTETCLDPQELIAQADAALYQAKSAGRDCVRSVAYDQAIAPDLAA
jgi:diguanylate cyclase (GGDEF)-like protein/PAS domain S-box-containing protein